MKIHLGSAPNAGLAPFKVDVTIPLDNAWASKLDTAF